MARATLAELTDYQQANILATSQSIIKRLGVHIRGIREGDLLSALSAELYAHEERSVKLHVNRWLMFLSGVIGLLLGLLIGTFN